MSLQKPLWTKGLMLGQQHLQAQDRYLEALLAFGVGATTPHPWGFSRLRLDAEALAEGMVSVLEAEGIFPDGLGVAVPEGDAAPAPLSLEGRWTGDRTSLTVYLAVPEHAPGGRLVSLDPEDRSPRFLAQVALRRDEATGLQEKPVQVARKNLRILSEEDGREGFALLPMARVLRRADGGFELDPGWVPPLLKTGASPVLMTRLRRLVEILVSRSSTLSGGRRERGRGLADFGVSDVANFWLLYTVNTHLPALRGMLERPDVHPLELFRELSELAGALTTFSTTVSPASLPAWDHAAPAGPFRELDELLRTLLETVVPTNHVTLPLKEVENAIHAVAIDKDAYLAPRALFLAVAGELPPDEMVRRAPQLIKVGSSDQVVRLVRQALPGMALRHAARPPSELPVKLDFQYFELETSGAAWDAVRAARNLAAYVPMDMPGSRLELVILLHPS